MQQVFFATLNQMVVFILMMIIGFILNRKNITDKKLGQILSQLQTNVIMPALVFQTFSQKLTQRVILKEANILFYGVCVLLASWAIALLISGFFTKDGYVRNLYIYSFTIANLGYMGYAIISSVFGQDALFQMMVFTIPFNIFIYSVGVSILKPENKKLSFKALINPIFIAMILGSIAGLVEIPIPLFITSTFSSLSSCMGPLAMLLTGFIIAEYDVNKLIINGKVYIASLIRLVMIPVLTMLVMKAFGASYDILVVTLGTVAMPLGLNTVIFPAAYGGDTSVGASMALISNIIGIITIPIMFALFLFT